jgi:general secretion pathway protein E
MEDTRMTATPEGDGEEWLSLAEALEFLGISKQTLYRLLERGDLKGAKVGRQWRFARADLRAYLERGPESAAMATVSADALQEALAALTVAMRNAGAGEVDTSAATAEARVSALLNGVLRLALRAGASDLHLEPMRDVLLARVRVDGALREVLRVPRAAGAAIVGRLKTLCEMSVEERRLPQDGRLMLRDAGHAFDLRVSTVPTLHGESAVLRVLVQDLEVPSLDVIMAHTPALLARLRALLAVPRGVLVFAGPTGSGKTTALYAALTELARPEVKVLTIEDPIEYALTGMVQIAVNMRAGLTFPRAMRAVMRQDPDVVMLGEARDLETLELCAQAALTGHLVLTTLHAESAAATLTRMVEMGLEPFLISGAVSGVLLQRLARRLCPDCREPIAPPAEALAALGTSGSSGTFYRAVGCAKCRNTGYRGRLALHELLVMDEPLAALAAHGAGTAELARAAEAGGMIPLVRDSVAKAAAGLTTMEEILRITALR